MGKNERRVKLFLVDDDVVFLKMLEIEFLQLANFSIRTFTSGELCISSLKEKPDIIILDYLLDGTNKSAMNGIDTLDKIKAYDPEIEIIILSAQDKIEVAVSCMHHNAYDYVVKSETAFFRLQVNISKIAAAKKLEKQLQWYRSHV